MYTQLLQRGTQCIHNSYREGHIVAESVLIQWSSIVQIIRATHYVNWMNGHHKVSCMPNQIYPFESLASIYSRNMSEYNSSFYVAT